MPNTFVRRLLPCLAVLLPATPALAVSPTLCEYDSLVGTISSFEDFALRASEQVEVQRLVLGDQVMVEYLDMEAQPEPAMVETAVAASEIAVPFIPPLDQVGELGLVYEIEAQPDSEMAVVIRGEDSGVRVDYIFALAPCWTLVRVRDSSM